MSNAITDYKLLFERFLSGAMSVEEFQAAYQRFRDSLLGEPLFASLDELFGDVDSFTTDPGLLAEKPEFYLNEAGLREEGPADLAGASAAIYPRLNN